MSQCIPIGCTHSPRCSERASARKVVSIFFLCSLPAVPSSVQRDNSDICQVRVVMSSSSHQFVLHNTIVLNSKAVGEADLSEPRAARQTTRRSTRHPANDSALCSPPPSSDTVPSLPLCCSHHAPSASTDSVLPAASSPLLCPIMAAAAAPSSMGNAADFEYSLTCLGAGYVGGPTMVSRAAHSRCGPSALLLAASSLLCRLCVVRVLGHHRLSLP